MIITLDELKGRKLLEQIAQDKIMIAELVKNLQAKADEELEQLYREYYSNY